MKPIVHFHREETYDLRAMPGLDAGRAPDGFLAGHVRLPLHSLRLCGGPLVRSRGTGQCNETGAGRVRKPFALTKDLEHGPMDSGE